MPDLRDRPDLPSAARWTALGGFLIEVGGLATAAQLGAAERGGPATPAEVGMGTLLLFLLGLIVAFCGASAFVVPWTLAQRLIGGVAATLGLIVAVLELSWGATLSLLTVLGAATSMVATWPWAGPITSGPGFRNMRG